jgi:putative transposase
MLRAFKTEVELTEQQKQIFVKTVGVMRFVKNLYIERNQEVYKAEDRFVTAYEFSTWLNNEYLADNPDKQWVKEVYQKAVKQAVINTETAYKRFFKRLAKYPRFACKSKQDTKFYFVRNGKNQPIKASRISIQVPTLGWVFIKEKGYIPVEGIRSGTIQQRGGRYFISVLADVDLANKQDTGQDCVQTSGLGLDFGIKSPVMDSNGVSMTDIEKTGRVRFLEKKLKRERRRLPRMWEANVKDKQYYTSGKKKGQLKSFSYKRPLRECRNYQKQRKVVQGILLMLDNIRLDIQKQKAAEWVRTKPAYIAIEDLNVRGMLKNRHLARAVSKRNFYRLRLLLTQKCAEHGIQLRIVNRWYPSSKTCHNCGHYRADLKLSDRIFACPECGVRLDRDYNAAMNLRDTKDYAISDK